MADVDAELVRHRLRNKYPTVRYRNQPRGPAVAADAEDHLYVDAACEAEILELAAEAAAVKRAARDVPRCVETRFEAHIDGEPKTKRAGLPSEEAVVQQFLSQSAALVDPCAKRL